MQLNSLSSSSSYSSRRLLSSGLSSSFYCTHQTQLVGSSHFSGWHFHLLFFYIFPFFFCVCVISLPTPPIFFFVIFQKMTSSFFRWITITKIWLCVHNLFSKSSFIFSVYLKKFPFLFRHLTFGDLWHTGIPKNKRKPEWVQVIEEENETKKKLVNYRVCMWWKTIHFQPREEEMHRKWKVIK